MRLRRNLIVALAMLFFLGGPGLFPVQPIKGVLAQQDAAESQWTGKTADGTVITKIELALLLADHKKWVDTDGKEGKKLDHRGVNLAKADLSGADLTGAYLPKANLREADLSGTDLTAAYLFEADLSRSNLRDANLKDSILAKADLSGADLSGANLGLAGLGRADLSNANLMGANLHKTNLRANLNGANLEEANLSEADLKRSNLKEANLRGADLHLANLSDANLQGADLSGVNLQDVDLRGANLKSAVLIGANLKDARMGGANLGEADLRGAIFEPLPTSLPLGDALATAQGLGELWHENAPQSLVKVRRFFREAGYSRQEREIGVSLQRSETLRNWEKGGQDSLKAAFTYVFADLTCNYGLSVWRPLALAGLGVLCFFPFYCLALTSRRADTGIWLTWPPDRVLMKAGQEKPEKLTTTPRLGPPSAGGLGRLWWQVRRVGRVIGLGLYFSLISAFSPGWRAFPFGSWISRLQPQEYVLRATGWVRTLAGLQSAISAFLIILWAFLFLASLMR